MIIIFRKSELTFLKCSTHLKYNSKECILLLYKLIDYMCVILYEKKVSFPSLINHSSVNFTELSSNCKVSLVSGKLFSTPKFEDILKMSPTFVTITVSVLQLQFYIHLLQLQ